jgi:uncharacterized protein (DUF2062 family)
MLCALASTAVGKPVRRDLAMTGEITLRGEILPVGGIKEKVLAALRAGINEVCLPRENQRDLSELPAPARSKLQAHLLSRRGVLNLAWSSRRQPRRPTCREQLLVRAKGVSSRSWVGDRPERLAAAWALGIGIGLSPLIGLHTVIALALAIVFRLNKLDVVLGTLIINPWTMPIYFPVAVLLGKRVTGVDVPRFVRFQPESVLDLAVWRENAPWLKSMLLAWGVGAAILALLACLATYLLLRRVIRVHREHHLRRQAHSDQAGPGS